MSNLIKPADYAKKLGISRQAVYAKIKKGLLESKSIDGKLYILDEVDIPGVAPSAGTVHAAPSPAHPHTAPYQELLAAKDETIGVLKETIHDLKETNQMITSTLRSEVELLKEAFSEMKTLYANQIEHLSPEPISETIDVDEPLDEFEEMEAMEEDVILASDTPVVAEEESTLPEEGDDLAWIELDDFFDEHNIGKKKKREKITRRLDKLFRKGDSRVDSFNGELIVLAHADYDDVLKKTT